MVAVSGLYSLVWGLFRLVMLPTAVACNVLNHSRQTPFSVVLKIQNMSNVTSLAVIIQQVSTIKWLTTDTFYRNRRGLAENIDRTVAVYWTWSQIVTNSQLTPRPAEPLQASESLPEVLTTSTSQQKSPRSSCSARRFLARIFLARSVASFVLYSLI